MAQLKGSRTEQNMMTALQGESVARNRYTFFEEKAKKEGNEAVAQLFDRMAKNEMFHARLWFRLLGLAQGDSGANLRTAADGEHTECTVMYPEFAVMAREEGFEEIAQMFDRVSAIEKDHEATFLKAYQSLLEEQGEAVGKARTQGVIYRCQHCGALYDEKPDACSVCGYKDAFDEERLNA